MSAATPRRGWSSGALKAFAFAALLAIGCAHAPPATGPQLRPSSRAAERKELIARLKRDLVKVERSIGVTERLIAQSRSAPYEPDLIFRLAELYVEKSRYRFHLEAELREETGKQTSIVVPDVTLLKQKAISLYQRILREFPEYEEADKVRFFMAHEQRELGQFDDALKTYAELLEKHPKSALAPEALLVMGDYHFDKSELDKAESYYLKIVSRPHSPAHDLANYKLGWVWINRGKHAQAVKYFEAAAKSPLGDDADTKALSVKGLALSDLVYSYTEARPAKGSVEYFEALADSSNTFEVALEKLGNRYFIKDEFPHAAAAYRKLLLVSRDPERDPERAERLYEIIRNSKGKVLPTADDVRNLVRVAARARLDTEMPEEERARLLEDFEVYARDLSTRLHVYAQRRNNAKLQSEAADAYLSYLSLFQNEKHVAAMKRNLAEALFAAKRFPEAGRAYEELALAAEGDGREEPLYTSLVAFHEALKEPEKLNYFERVDARSAIKQLGSFYVKNFPKNQKVPTVKFNVARAYYDDGDFRTSAELFLAYATEHPKDKDAPAAANLALDSLHHLKDYRGIEEAGKKLMAVAALPASLKKEINDIVTAARTEELAEVMIASDDGDAGVVERLMKVADERGTTDIADKALQGALTQAVSRRNIDEVQKVTDAILAKFPKSASAANAILTMARFATDMGDYDAAARHLESMEQHFPGDPKTIEALDTAAAVRQMLGEADRAVRDLEKVAAATRGAEPLARLAEVKLEQGDLAGAEQAAEAALARDPGSARAAAVLGRALLDQNRHDEAQQKLVTAGRNIQKAVDTEPEALARVYFLWGESMFRQFAELGPEELEWKAQLLQMLEQAYSSAASLGGDWAVAGLFRLGQSLNLLADALAAMPEPPNLTAKQKQEFKQAIAEQVKPLREQAGEVLKTCVRKSRELDVYTPFALACATGKEVQEQRVVVPARPDLPAERVAEYRKALADNPANVEALAALGRAYLEAGDLRRARLVFSRLLEVDENQPVAHATLGFLLVKLGEPQLAMHAYKRALELDGRDEKTRVNAAALMCKYGNVEGARKELARVKSVPSGPDVDADYAACRR